MEESEVRTNALAALYQGEKADAAAIFGVSLALIGAGIAYVAAVVAFSDKFGTGIFGWGVVLFVPLPLWLIAGFHSLIVGNAMRHGVSVRIIENELFRLSRFNLDRDLVGSAAGDSIMDVGKSGLVHKITSYTVYGGESLVILGFTALIINAAWDQVPRCASITAVVAYVLLAGLVAGSWLASVRSAFDADMRSQRNTRGA